MDGKALTQKFLDALNEASVDMEGLNARSIFECLDEAAICFVRETGSLKDTVTIITVEDRQAYDLPPGFIRLYVKNGNRRFVAKYHDADSGVTAWPVCSSFEKIFCANRTDPQEYPSRFAIMDKMDSPDPITGETTSPGANNGGASALIDSGADFAGSIFPRTRVHNLTRKADGMVTKAVSGTQLETAMYSGSAPIAWQSADSYMILPSAHKQVYLDAPSKTAGHTICIPYICMPRPVFSDYGTWRFSPRSCHAICYEAAYLYGLKRPQKYTSALAQYHKIFTGENTRVKTEIAADVLQGQNYLQRR